MKKLAVVMALGSVVGFSACSVKKSEVPNNPPETSVNLKAFGFTVASGKLYPQIISGLFWPQWDESVRESRVMEINQKSRAMNGFIIQKILLKKVEISTLWSVFRGKKCIESFAVVEPETDINDVEEDQVWDWKPLASVDSGQPGYDEYIVQKKLLDECVANQDKRNRLRGEIGEAQAQQSQPGNPVFEADAAISKYLGPEDLVPMEKSGSSILITPKKVVVVLRKFNNSGITQTSDTEGVDPSEVNSSKYIKDVRFEKNRLRFTVPGVGENEGKYYVFMLERIANLAAYKKEVTDDETGEKTWVDVDYAVFKGELILTSGGKVLRKGNAQIIGEFVAQ